VAISDISADARVLRGPPANRLTLTAFRIRNADGWTLLQYGLLLRHRLDALATRYPLIGRLTLCLRRVLLSNGLTLWANGELFMYGFTLNTNGMLPVVRLTLFEHGILWPKG